MHEGVCAQTAGLCGGATKTKTPLGWHYFAATRSLVIKKSGDEERRHLIAVIDFNTQQRHGRDFIGQGDSSSSQWRCKGKEHLSRRPKHLTVPLLPPTFTVATLNQTTTLLRKYTRKHPLLGCVVSIQSFFHWKKTPK